jgi:hypothetical protein
MNHNVTLSIAAIVTAIALTAVAFAVPQQVLAYGHHHNHNSIKVDQQINQQNVCSEAIVLPPYTTCDNEANNSADIHR